LKLLKIPESTYYYQESSGQKGVKPSEYTYHQEKGYVSNQVVIQEIKDLLAHEFIDCGYRIMTCYLQRKGYRINHKKVYRLMQEESLLIPTKRIQRGQTPRKRVQFRKVETSRPMQVLEMDIKFVWIPEKGKNAYLLSVIDVHTRKILGDYFAYSIKKDKVIKLLSDIFMEYDYPESVIIRNDNGSQFAAKEVQQYLKDIQVEQEFTHVATPEENAHVEAYHGTLKRDIFNRFDYYSFKEIEAILKRYVTFYNTFRIHGLLGKITPQEKWEASKHLIQYRKFKQQLNAA
jgi:transposase InsO family protein